MLIRFCLHGSPWVGGFYERIIGITKMTLQKTLGKARLNYEELYTVVTEVECTLNDRPLTYIDATDGLPLTLSHLMYGRTLKTLPRLTTNAIQTSVDTLQNQASRISNVLNHYKLRWKHEYLTALRERHLSNQKPNIQQTIKVGDIVIFHTDNKKRLEWPLAKVLKLSQGNDGYIHSAQIKMQNGVTQRPIVKLYPLEINAATELCGEITNTTPQASTRDTQSAVVPNSPPPLTETLTPQPSTPDTHDERRPRASAIKAKQTIKTWTKQFNKTN